MMKLEQYSDKILEQLQLGTPLTKICKQKDMPGLTTVYKWAREDKEFAADLQEARKTGAATWLDRCLELLEQKDIPPNQLGFLREQMHHYRWLASKLISVYGDKSEVKQTGESTIKVMWEGDLATSTQETQALAHGKGVQEIEEKKQLSNPDL
tara:strand:- start:1017 stop:1475 length:459 start_codon:yes stop_codon:yes gene_type:complete